MSALHIVSDPVTDPTTPADLADEFSFSCGCRLLPWMPDRFAAWLKMGFTLSAIREAIRRTSWAPCPSWRYLEAVMRNASRSGRLDELAFSRPVSAHRYQQRPYREEDFASVEKEMLEEAKRIKRGEE